MEEGGPRIRRRVSVRKRSRPSIGSSFAAPTAAELKPSDEKDQGEEEEEEEKEAGSRRRRTVDVRPAEVQRDQGSHSVGASSYFHRLGR